MSKKQALAVLHTAKSFLYRSQDYNSDTNGAFRQEVSVAFSVLAQAIHGKPVDGYSTLLCDRCHLHYGPHWVEYQKEGRDYSLHLSLCPPCLVEAKTLLTVLTIDFEPYQPDEHAPQASTSLVLVEHTS
jgi:hypothetical protein